LSPLWHIFSSAKLKKLFILICLEVFVTQLKVPFSPLRLNTVRGNQAIGLDVVDLEVGRPTLLHCALCLALDDISMYNQLIGLRNLILVKSLRIESPLL